MPPTFTCDLGVNGLLLLRQAGIEPLAQVMGRTSYAISAPRTSAVSGELKILTGAYAEAQRLVLERLRDAAIRHGANGIVGVRLIYDETREGEAGVLNLSAIGTAVHSDWPAHDGPWLSGLTGDALWTLRQTGFRPVGLAIGNCAYYRVASAQGLPPAALQSGWRMGVNVERRDYTDALYGARHLAMRRMEDDAARLHADGILGVTVQVERHFGATTGWLQDLFCRFFAVGTAVAAGAAPSF